MPALPLHVLSVIPPMTQLNTPYPSTAYLTGFLRSRGVAAVQEDLALALVLHLLSPEGLRAVAAQVDSIPHKKQSHAVQSFAAQKDRYLATIGPAIAFLQGRDSTLAHRIVGRNYLPEGPRFATLDVYVDDEGGDPLGWCLAIASCVSCSSISSTSVGVAASAWANGSNVGWLPASDSA